MFTKTKVSFQDVGEEMEEIEGQASAPSSSSLFTKAMNTFTFHKTDNRVVPVDNSKYQPTKGPIKVCMMCFEPGALKRQCCNALYCDHCYVKNQKCPNCGVQTKQEKLTGATYQLKIFSEHEECRVCLDPGLKRRCCGNYYCDDCFYKSPTCRSCGTPVSKARETSTNYFEFNDTMLVSVLIGWSVTVFVALISITFLAVVIFAETSAPVGISDYTCYGFFRDCGISVCIDMDATVAAGTSPIPPLSSWTRCTTESVAKLESKACVYDQNLYHQTNRELGYDVCVDNFNDGIYIFEDTYEYWKNTTYQSNIMKSSAWSTIVNGFAESYCGVGEVFGGSKALIFGGDTNRYAETKDFDMRRGGKIESEMFLPPIGYDVLRPFCKTGYIGTVYVQYSINKGVNWTTLAMYEPAVWRQDTFFTISLDVPTTAQTNMTRFRFIQPIFEAARDAWALDNTRILRYLPSNWQTYSPFMKNLHTAQHKIQLAQCCLDTDWCEHRLTEADKLSKCKQFDWFSDTKAEYLFRLSEVFLVMVVILNVLRAIYMIGYEFYIYERIPFQDEITELVAVPWLIDLWKKIPIEYRQKIHYYIPVQQYIRRFEKNEINQIHTKARFATDIRHKLDDAEGEGHLLKRQEIIEQEQKKYYRKLRKQQKLLEKRKAKKNFKASTLVVEEEKEYENELKTYVIPFDHEQNTKSHKITRVGSPNAKLHDVEHDGDGMGFDGNGSDTESSPLKPTNNMMNDPAFDPTLLTQGTVLLDETEKLRRQNIGMLMIPFEFDSDNTWRRWFGIISILVFVILFLYVLSTTSSFSIYVPLSAFNMIPWKLYTNSIVLILFAGVCDFKEIYYLIKYVIPIRDKWLPQITLDLTDDIRSLFLGFHRVPIDNIREITAFTPNFVYLCAAGYCFAAFPWCLLSMLLRQAVLQYSSMRFVTPFLGCIMVLRATLGPSFVIKMMFTFEYLFETKFQIREKIGESLQQTSSIHIAINFSLMMCILGTFFCLISDMNYAAYIFGAALFGGFIYGLFTGTLHQLPIKPYMYLTTLRAGVWVHMRRKHKCPCIYWGKYCTEVNSFEELMVLFTTDDMKFTSLINNGIHNTH